MELIIVFIAGIIVGWFWHARALFKRLTDNPQAMIALLQKYKNEQQEDSAVSEVRPIRVEKHGDQLYLYAEDTDEFLAQAATIDEALVIVSKRFPNQDFRGLIPKEDADKWGLSKQQ